jgi:uncharacterized protein (TIRG00374 family)
LVALVVVFSVVDLESLVEALRLADYGLVLLVFVISIIWLSLRTYVWRSLLMEKPTFSQTFLTINEGYLLNNILPFRLGEVGRAYLLGKKAGLDFWQVLSTIVIERALDVAFAAGLLLSTLPFVLASETDWAVRAAILAGSLVCIGLVLLFFLARYRQWALEHFDRLALRWTFLQKFGGSQLHAFLNGLVVLTNPVRFLKTVGLVTLNWLVAILQYYVLLRAFFPDGELLWAAFSLGVVALGIATPSSPGAVGVLELSMVGALSLFSLDATTALAMAITGHLSNYMLTGLIGIYALGRDGTSLASVYRKVKELKTESEIMPLE